MFIARWGKSALGWWKINALQCRVGTELESMLVKKVGSLSLGCSPFLFFFILLCSKLYATYAFFFSFSISVFLLCIGIGIILFQK